MPMICVNVVLEGYQNGTMSFYEAPSYQIHERVMVKEPNPLRCEWILVCKDAIALMILWGKKLENCEKRRNFWRLKTECKAIAGG